MRTPLGNVRGLGSAKDGVNHFIKQRVTAIALVFLIPWFFISLFASMSGDDAATRYQAAVTWIANPLHAVLSLLLIGAGSYHMRLGLQVVIEDYITGHGMRIFLLILNTFASVFLFAAAAFAIFKIAG